MLVIVSMVACVYNPSTTLEAKSGELPQVQEQPGLYSEFQSSLGYRKRHVPILSISQGWGWGNILYMIEKQNCENIDENKPSREYL